MRVAQRGTSSTNNGVATVDRMSQGEGGLDETCTQSQITLNSTDVGPYAKGFRHAYRIQNGNQTSGVGGTDFIRFEYRIEAQDVANSGWDYTSSSSYLTVQFWVRSSVAQNFYFLINSSDGTARSYPMETGSLSADTWTKVTKTISGDSVLTFNNDNGDGIQFFFYQYLGTSYTNNGVSLNNWRNVGNPQIPVATTTWFTTNNATWDITGLQMEVSDSASDFEHKSLTEEQQLCKRYFQHYGGSADLWHFGLARAESNTARAAISVPVPMRTSPTVGSVGGHRTFDRGYNSESTDTPSVYDASSRNNNLTDAIYTVDFPGHNLTHNRIYALMSKSSNTSDFTLDAEMG